MAETEELAGSGKRAGSAATGIDELVGSPVTALVLDSLERARQSSASLDHLRGTLSGLGRDGAALDLRLARLLAWFKGQDLAPLGYPSFGALCRALVEWKSSWLRGLVRLVQSPLDLVKQAVCDGLLPIREAVRVAARLHPDQQEAWLLARAAGSPHCTRWDDAARKDILTGADADTVRRARDLARLCLGWHAPDSVCDSTILQCWAEDRPAEAILNQARKPPPAPDLAAPAWPGADAALGIVGPWREPRDLQEGLKLLDEIQLARRARVVALGLACDQVAERKLWKDLGYDTLASFARGLLGLSLRTVQRYRRLGRQLDRYPELARAVAEGLDLDRALAVADLSWGLDSARPWLDLAQRIGVAQLRDAAARTRRHGSALDELSHFREVAELVDSDRRATDAGTEPATDAGTEPVMVARPPRPLSEDTRGEPLWTRAHPRLLEAARWFLDTVQPPPQTGFGKVKERDRWTCQNPECGRRTLRNEAHHIRFRSQGGSDDLDNGLCLCRSCHLRLIHTGHVQIERRGPLLLWRFPDRTVAVPAP